MEALLIIGALAAGSHYILNDDVPNNAIHSSQTAKNISTFKADINHELSLAQIDWSKAGNFKVGDSPETGVQWVFLTGK